MGDTLMSAIFNSRSKSHKTPFGAVKANEDVNITVLVPHYDKVKQVKLLIRSKDYENAIVLTPQPHGSDYTKYVCTFSLDIPNVYFYRFEVFCQNGEISFCGSDNGRLKNGDWLPEWQLTVYNHDYETPDWAKGKVMYQIFPDRFARSKAYEMPKAKNDRIINNDWYATPDSPHVTENYSANDFFCGNLMGIMERLPYLKSLGVGIIYLNPIFESPENHRYSTADYTNIDPYLGTNEIFIEFAKQCKQVGINLILDGVFSHTGADSIYFNKYSHFESQGAAQGAHSNYYAWYNFIEFPDVYESWWGFNNLPNVNELNPDYLSFITAPEEGVLNLWQKRGCSGYRLDVADELPDEFLNKLRESVKTYDKESLIIGEVWEDASNKQSYGNMRSYLLGNQLDSVMNYPWRSAVIDFVLKWDAKSFKHRILGILENYPLCAVDTLMNILSTHDTRRIINELGIAHDVERSQRGFYTLTEQEYALGVNRLKIASFIQFTLPGIPCVYYGDEAGMTGFEDPFCRRGFPYGKEDLALTEFFKGLGRLREQNQDDFKTSADFVFKQADDGCILFKRRNISCFVNPGNKPKFIEAYGLTQILFATGDAVLSKYGVILPPAGAAAIL